MYQHIYVPLDSSEHSNACIEVALSLAHIFGAKLTGSHVYAARMHDYRFKQMEYTLPEEYQDEQELERQRKIHDSLITHGLRLISDSYCDVMRKRCAEEHVPFAERTMDGKHWQEIVKDVAEHDYDLVIMGAQGVGAVKDAQLGGVTLRVARRIKKDLLVVKDTKAWTDNRPGSIAVAIDGSPQSFAGLKTAIALGQALGRPVEAIAAYDPYLHYAVFNNIVGVLSQEAAKVFRFKEQEQLHEEIIDTGLAKIYQSHLQVARRIAAEEGSDLKVTLMDGKAWDKIVQWARKERPWLLILGRIGIHSDDTMDIGSNAENVLRMVSCNVLLSSRQYVPPINLRAEETITWTPEATGRMEKIPLFMRGLTRTAIHRYAIERGHSIISVSIVDDALRAILPASAVQALGVPAKSETPAETMASPCRHALSAQQGGSITGHIAVDSTYICGECGYAARNVLPVSCPVCHAGPQRFALVNKQLIEEYAASQGEITEEEAFDGIKLRWTEEAKKRLWMMADAYARRRAKARIEKLARVQRLPVITLEFADPLIQETIGELNTLHSNQGDLDVVKGNHYIAGAGDRSEERRDHCPVHQHKGQDTSRADGQPWLNEITPYFIAQLEKKFGSGYPARELTRQEQFHWTSEAEAQLMQAPDYCREVARWHVEWVAYKQNLGRVITLEVLYTAYQIHRADPGHINGRQMTWEPAAEERLERVPGFLRDQVVQAIEGSARQVGTAIITAEVVDWVVEQWRRGSHSADKQNGHRGYAQQ
jgi:nucleotide-binding universal stress UspA family protein